MVKTTVAIPFGAANPEQSEDKLCMTAYEIALAEAQAQITPGHRERTSIPKRILIHQHVLPLRFAVGAHDHSPHLADVAVFIV